MADVRRARGRQQRRRRRRLLPEIIEELNQLPNEEPAEQQPVPELPTELLQVIISRLTLRDNICASAVSKSWLDAAVAVRKADKPPLLMIFPKFGDLYEFYDPSRRKSFWIDLPELHGSQVRCAKHGWLLLYKPDTTLVFMFSPYNRDLIQLPDLDLEANAIAFSAAPTSPNCVVFTVKNSSPTRVSLSTWRPGESEWSTGSYHSSYAFPGNRWNKIVFVNGHFCCLSNNGLLGVYNAQTRNLKLILMQLPRFIDNFVLVEHNGDVFIIATYSDEYPIILKVDLKEKACYQIETLGGMTFFVNCLCSLARTDLLGQ